MFPMTIIKRSADNRGDHKSYHVVYITAGNGHTVLIKRWGKKGAQGQMKAERYANIREGDSAYNFIFREKFEGEYTRITTDTRKVVNNEEEFRKELGPLYLNNMGADNLKHLLPDADTKGVRDPVEDEWEVDPKTGKRVRKDRQKLVEEVEPTIEERVAANPLWGMF